ncbi:MAG: alpha/beta hydrolase [Anaerolineales bacterium]|nr:alpha/beta hydrolase [Anaerolineales bacterium]
MKRFLLITAFCIFLLVLVGPFLVPIPPLEGIQLIEQLAEADSRFINIEDLQVHYKITGRGNPPLVLLHGFGASLFSWREVMEPFGQEHRVVAFDRPAFGLTERPMEWQGDNPYSPESQARLTIGLMDQLDIEKAILVGNSAGGSIAVLTALRYPERVQALILVDPAIYTGGSPSWFAPIAKTPQMQRIGPLIARNILGRGSTLINQAWHDPSKITAEVLEGYIKPTRVENWDRALWHLTTASQDLNLDQQLDQLKLPVLVITGDDDRIVPTEDSIRLAGELPNAELVVIPACGHVPHEECPQAFLEAVLDFLARLP